ncbi:class I SAM-dependent methyltransferase [Desulfosediminicola flagellatus]|uniref:class I SAM-dependent methyltransferase n=1 Tax=Desulfosediminicola flagellatus TaxID=2569541 RepID=UPI00142EB5BF|nr:class I SAM-dependent methyltransferase [Desulfosediminicola flagellatus]
MKISENTRDVWKVWFSHTRSRCHLHFNLEGGTISSHITMCTEAAKRKMQQLVEDFPQSFRPKTILEIGASVGFNSLALSDLYPDAVVYSVEPDNEAVLVAGAMASDASAKYQPVTGAGEFLPFGDGYFDLVICHTVIEHVSDVERVVSEMARVLSPDGYIHLEAPNYLWPYEPHLDVWCLPFLGKAAVRFAARVQGKKTECWYLEHLQFVTPFQLTAFFKQQGLSWENRFKKKLADTIAGTAEIRKYTFFSKLMYLLGKVGLAQAAGAVVVGLGLYPSVLYTLYRSEQGAE